MNWKEWDCTIDWLLEGDVSIQYQTRKYLLEEPEMDLLALRRRIASEGWGQQLLACRRPSGHWGEAYYHPKWTSSHYTLLDLRYLEIEPVEPIMETLALILNEQSSESGGIRESKVERPGDLCVNGMFLNYAAFFGVSEGALHGVVDYLLDHVMPDGGFNCDQTRYDVKHSSMHTTLSVLEGLMAYQVRDAIYRGEEIRRAIDGGQSFLLRHRLFRSDRTGEVIDPRWKMLSFPSRWRYDVLRVLLYFVDAKVTYDPRMQEAIDLLLSKRRKDGTWPVQAKHTGQVHFDMEKTGGPSRWNTLRALRVLKWYNRIE